MVRRELFANEGGRRRAGNGRTLPGGGRGG